MAKAKSHEPVNPTPRKRPPPWVGGAKKAVVTTDDADFGLVFVLLDGGYYKVAWTDGRKRWKEVRVTKSRVTSLQWMA